MGIPDLWLDDDDRMGWDGVYHHRHLHETRHYQQPTNQTTKQPTNQPTNQRNTMQTTTTIYSRYTFMMIPPSFEKDNVFFLDEWRERERRERII